MKINHKDKDQIYGHHELTQNGPVSMGSGTMLRLSTSGSSWIKGGHWRQRFCGVHRLWLQDLRITPLKTVNYLPGAKLDYCLPRPGHQELSKNEILVG